MKVYIDPNTYHCYANNPNGIYREIETNFFYGKCTEFIEGYCYDDSHGYPKIYPWKNYSGLDAAQRKYERQQLSEYKESLEILGIEI